MNFIRRILTGLIALLGLIYGIFFSIRNMDVVAVNLPFFGEYKVASFMAFLAAFILGLLVAGLYCSLELVRKSMQVRRLRKELNGSKRQGHKRVRRFLKEEEPLSQTEPSVLSSDAKEF